MNEFTYKYKDGRFLRADYMGDGEYGLTLVESVSSQCVFSDNWDLSEILDHCDSVYDESGEYIADTLDESDFTKQDIEIKLK